MDIKEIIDSQEYIDIVMSILEITGEKLTERNLMSDQYLREDIKKAAIEGEVLYNFLKDNKLMIIKYAICRQQYNSFKKDISELEGDDFKVVKYLGNRKIQFLDNKEILEIKRLFLLWLLKMVELLKA